MGAKQSKRSVDISGKEAEGAGEVAVAGAGGEGRVEQLADADALKPQQNGDAHIQPPEELTEKEKQLDSGTPENEKDATTEKEGKEENGTEKEKVVAPVTNGDSEQKGENGETTPTSEDGKKPKKEKVKKKWSLRSISFSRKDKPKQEKKQKEEDAKTNGEPEKVPEEAAEATEVAENKIIEEIKPETESKDEKAPETPVTEPMTNGSSTPETPKVESPAIEIQPAAPVEENDRIEPKVEVEQEKLPVNGLSLEETEQNSSEVLQNKEVEPVESIKESTVPAPEISVKTEVCEKQMPLVDTSPPPLPTNPPPSSVASFAATTMAPELSNASLANTSENAAKSPPAFPDIKQNIVENNVDAQNISPSTENITNENVIVKEDNKEDDSTTTLSDMTPMEEEVPNQGIVGLATDDNNKIGFVDNKTDNINIPQKSGFDASNIVNADVQIETIADPNSASTCDVDVAVLDQKNVTEPLPLPPSDVDTKNIDITNSELKQSNIETKENIANLNSTFTIDTNIDKININGHAETEHEDSKKVQENETEAIECNGNICNEKTNEITESVQVNDIQDDKMVIGSSQSPSLSEGKELPDERVGGVEGEECDEASESFPPPPSASELAAPEPAQGSLPVSDKLADLIPEIPAVPELKTDMDTTSDVVVAN